MPEVMSRRGLIDSGALYGSMILREGICQGGDLSASRLVTVITCSGGGGGGGIRRYLWGDSHVVLCSYRRPVGVYDVAAM